MKGLFQTASNRKDNLALAVIVGLAVLKLVIQPYNRSKAIPKAISQSDHRI